MPKSSIAKKKLDSKNKRMFKGRQKGRQIKKNRDKDIIENQYVNKLNKMKEKHQKMAKRFNVVAVGNQPKEFSEDDESKNLIEDEESKE